MPTAGPPSRSAAPTLFDLAARSLTHTDAFALSQDQQAVLRHVHRVLADEGGGQRAAVVVAGTAGSGKSALALTLLGEAVRAGYRARHATGSQAFTTALRKTAGHGSRARQQLFQYFGTAADTERGELDLLVCDDAHQLRATSNTRYTPASRRSDRTQTEQLLDAARVVVFLLDEGQAIRPGQIGTRAYIETTARACGATVHTAQLASQHRHRNTRYASWVHRLLRLDDALPPASWNADEEAGQRFELRVADSPHELEQLLHTKTERGASARMTAGLCWPWSEARPGSPLVNDIVIGDWNRPWSVKGHRAVNGLPPSPLWALEPAGAGQVGCVYSAQGFEYDYGGVILGPDLRWRGDRWITDPAATRDDALDRAPAADLDLWVRRTYSVLLTRARAGTVLYSTDAETRALLHGIIDA